MLSKTGLYVVRALAEMAKVKDGSWLGTATLAKEIGAPVNYLGKLLHVLAREGIVFSRKGVGGGVRLARAPKDISLYDALNPFEDFPHWDECLLGHEACPGNNPCHFANRWNPIRESVIQFLHETSAADLATQMGFHRRFERSLRADVELTYEQQAS